MRRKGKSSLDTSMNYLNTTTFPEVITDHIASKFFNESGFDVSTYGLSPDGQIYSKKDEEAPYPVSNVQLGDTDKPLINKEYTVKEENLLPVYMCQHQ